MSQDVVAFPRRQGVILACVMGEEPGRGDPGRAPPLLLSLVAEDGACFRLPAGRAVARVEAPLAREGDESDVAWLGRVRAAVRPFGDWLALRTRLADGVELTTEEIAAELGDDSALGCLAVALGSEAAAPWFRRVDGRFVVVSMQAALLRLFELNRERFEALGDEALFAWWETDSASSAPPAATTDALLAVRLAEERARFFEPGYVADRDLAAAAALADVVQYARSGDGDAAPRGAAFARRIGRVDDADRLVEDLVARGALDPSTDPSAHRAGLAAELDDDAAADAVRVAALPATASPEGGTSRVDLSGQFAVAVDSSGTFEVDDAVSLRRVGDVVEILVHVADCGRVAVGTPLDAWARSRASSLYVPDGTVPLFPRPVVATLSLCAETRPAVTLVATLDAEFAVVATRFEHSLVRVDRRVTYAETHEVAALAESTADGALLVRAAEALRAARRARGARIVTVPSADVTLVDGVPELWLRTQDAPGDLVVSEAMVLYNSAAADVLAAARAPALFRSQQVDADPRRRPPNPDDPLYEPRLRRSFPPTVVATEPAPHAGVGAAAYAQLTSPIRRYADLANQRQLSAAIAGTTPPLTHADVENLAEHLARRERRVRQAADARLKFWVARHVAGGGAETLEGLLSKLPRRGVGAVWVPALRREVTLKCERSWRPPAEGTIAQWRVARVLPWRGRIEVEPLPAQEPPGV